MAGKTFSIKDAIEVFNENTDMEYISEFTRRYPLIANTVIRLVLLSGEEMLKFSKYLPDSFTAQKMQNLIKKEMADAKADRNSKIIIEDDDEEAEDDVEEVEDVATETDDEESEPDAEEELPKPKKRGRPAKEKFEPEPEETESDNPYEGMDALSLYKLCKKRGIAAEQKKPARFYIQLLKEADDIASNKNVDAEEDSDSWDDVEEEVTKAPAPKAKTKKAEPEDEDEDTDDDEWQL